MLRLLLQFLCIIETNAFALEEPTYRMQRKLVRALHKNVINPSRFSIEKRQIGTALYISISRFNHSCDPNLAFVFDNKFQRIVLCSTRMIIAGEELTLSYGPIYHRDTVYIQLN